MMQLAAGLALIGTVTVAVSVFMTRASNLRPLASMALACVVAVLFAALLAFFVVIAMRIING